MAETTLQALDGLAYRGAGRAKLPQRQRGNVCDPRRRKPPKGGEPVDSGHVQAASIARINQPTRSGLERFSKVCVRLSVLRQRR